MIQSNIDDMGILDLDFDDDEEFNVVEVGGGVEQVKEAVEGFSVSVYKSAAEKLAELAESEAMLEGASEDGEVNNLAGAAEVVKRLRQEGVKLPHIGIMSETEIDQDARSLFEENTHISQIPLGPRETNDEDRPNELPDAIIVPIASLRNLADILANAKQHVNDLGYIIPMFTRELTDEDLNQMSEKDMHALEQLGVAYVIPKKTSFGSQTVDRESLRTALAMAAEGGPADVDASDFTVTKSDAQVMFERTGLILVDKSTESEPSPGQ